MFKFSYMRGCYILLLCLFAKGVAGQGPIPSKLYSDFVKDRTTSLLPDFSYAGYRAGEQALPVKQSYKVFNVLDYGAVPDDTLSDRAAIQAAIDAANKNGCGTIFFPKGRFLVNEDPTSVDGISSKGSNILFKGSGAGTGGTELYMKQPLLPEDPKKMWTSPSMFKMTAKGKDENIGIVVAAAKLGDRTLQLDATNGLKPGDWIALKLLDNSTELINETLAPYEVDPAWTSILKNGVDVCMYYQITAINGNTIQLHAPLAYAVDTKYKWSVLKFAYAEEIGIEDIAFVGNFHDKFAHHSSWQHDSGFSLFEFSRCTNSWMRNCRFTDCSVGAIVKLSANITIANCIVTGNSGHEAITSNHSMNILLADLEDKASQWHSFGSSAGAMNTVIWHCTYPATTCFESHASQPRNTLLDNVHGGLMQNRAGGALNNMPNHLKGLVFWNYTQTNNGIKDFEFWSSTSKWWKITPPIIAGFYGNGTTFKESQLAYIEGMQSGVSPQSLYEAQVQERLKKKAGWVPQLLGDKKQF